MKYLGSRRLISGWLSSTIKGRMPGRSSDAGKKQLHRTKKTQGPSADIPTLRHSIQPATFETGTDPKPTILERAQRSPCQTASKLNALLGPFPPSTCLVSKASRHKFFLFQPVCALSCWTSRQPRTQSTQLATCRSVCATAGTNRHMLHLVDAAFISFRQIHSTTDGLVTKYPYKGMAISASVWEKKHRRSVQRSYSFRAQQHASLNEKNPYDPLHPVILQGHRTRPAAGYQDYKLQ